MKKFECPEIEVTRFAMEDVMTVSGGGLFDNESDLDITSSDSGTYSTNDDPFIELLPQF